MSPSRWLILLISLSAVLVWLDYLSPPLIQFPAIFVVPVLLAAWYLGMAWGMAFAVVLPFTRLFLVLAVWKDPTDPPRYGLVNFAIRAATFALVVVLARKIRSLQVSLEKRVQVLEGFLPICSFCKDIRDEQGRWHPMESYISDRSEAMFSHGICEACAKKHYPELV